MAARPSWKGSLRVSLVSVPVQAFTAMMPEEGEIHLNQLHDKCHSRIRYQKVCPIHGEVTKDEIVSGYEFAKGQYVVIDEAEREQARAAGDKTLSIDRFVPPGAVDALYFAGQHYYLLPDGDAAEKPYVLLHKAMADERVQAVGQVVLSGRERVALVRPIEGLLTMSLLNFASQLKEPAEFRDQVAGISIKAEELKLARTLIEGTSEKTAKLDQFEDTYTDRLREVIEAKASGHEVVAPPEEEEVPVVNLMEALRKSVAQAKGGSRKPAKKLAASVRQLTPARRRRKSS